MVARLNCVFSLLNLFAVLSLSFACFFIIIIDTVKLVRIVYVFLLDNISHFTVL